MDDKDIDGPMYQWHLTNCCKTTRVMACMLFPNQCERRIAISEVISLMESTILQWDQNSIQKPVPEMEERQTTYCKIQEMVPLQDKIKEDE